MFNMTPDRLKEAIPTFRRIYFWERESITELLLLMYLSISKLTH